MPIQTETHIQYLHKFQFETDFTLLQYTTQCTATTEQ